MPVSTSADQDLLAQLKRNRERAIAFASQAGGTRTRALLEQAQRDLEDRLRKAEGLRGPGADSFTAAQLRVALEQVRDVLRSLKKNMTGELLSAGKKAAESAVQGTVQYLQDADAKFTGVSQSLALNEARMLDRVAKGTEASLLRRIATDPSHAGHQGVLDRYGEAVIGKFEEQLQLRFIAKRPWAEVRDSLVAQSDFLKGAPAHWAERIVRTEVMGAHGRASWETMRSAQQELPDMLKILSATFDNRTAADSYAVHGQIRRPDEAFESWFGLYQHPPNRPNDREVVVPHRARWPLPKSLLPKTDAEVAQRWAQEGRKGSPPPRPRMSTVDLDALKAGDAKQQLAAEQKPTQVQVPEKVTSNPIPAPKAGEQPQVEIDQRGFVEESPLPTAIRRGGYERNYRSLQRGLIDRNLDYLRDPQSYRDESFKAVGDVYEKGRLAGKTATQIATEVLDPITIGVDPDGKQFIRDGRHRYALARQQGASSIRAKVVQYGPKGGVRWEQEMVLPLR